ncbi:glycosyltransferase family 4 protein [candidate division WOR-3 bacterium]|nr:glycosyltransferase family 4 protein [candidate division WOR-3 bacterium]
MKKILVISPFKIFPTYSGFNTRVYNIIKLLSNRNKISFFYVDYNKKGVQSDENFLLDVAKYRFRTSKRWMQVFHPLLILKGIKIIKNEKIDLIIAESIWAGLHAVILHILTRVPYYFNEQNVEYVRWKRMGKKYSRILKICEKYCCKFAKKVFCVSESDRQLIHKLGIDIDKIIIIPNGVDTEKFKPDIKKRYAVRKKLGLSIEKPVILFFGDLSYIPNLQAVQIVHDILLGKTLNKIPDVKFLIVGSNPPVQYNHEAIIFTGIVEKIEDYINASDVVIAPLISGGGTKLKIIEAIACGKTVVTTSIGAEGLINEQTKDALRIADEWDKFVDEIVDTLKNPESDDIPKEFIEKYSWDSIGKIICETLKIEEE